MADLVTEEGRHIYVPEGFEGKPENVLDLLKRGRATLGKDAKWITGHLYGIEETDHPDLKDTPYCDNWGVCAIGAIQVTSLGLQRAPEGAEHCTCPGCITGWLADTTGQDEALIQMFELASARLNAASWRLHSQSSIVGFNDGSYATHEKVLGVFDNAIEEEQVLLTDQAVQ